jgi:hypothetical protein
MNMDKETADTLNDLLDIVEEVAKIVSELNPGANFGLIEFLIRRVEERLNKALARFD